MHPREQSQYLKRIRRVCRLFKSWLQQSSSMCTSKHSKSCMRTRRERAGSTLVLLGDKAKKKYVNYKGTVRGTSIAKLIKKIEELGGAVSFIPEPAT